MKTKFGISLRPLGCLVALGPILTGAWAQIQVFDARPLGGVNAAADQGTINAAYDRLLAGSAVAGLANRDGGEVFIRLHQVDDRVLSLLLQGSTPWQNAPTETVDAETLIQRHLSRIRGLVVWDPKVPATSNVAVAVAGAESAIPVRYDPSAGSLYQRLTGEMGLRPLVRFVDDAGASVFTGKGTIFGTSRKSTGSAKCDAYGWLIEKYVKKGKAGKGGFAGQTDAYPFFASGARLNMNLSDIGPSSIARMVELKGLVVDLLPTTDIPADDPKQKRGTDRAMLVEILKAVGANRAAGSLMQASGFVPWEKYTRNQKAAVNIEWSMSALLTSFDIYGGSTDNASFMSKDSFTPRYQQVKPTLADLQRRGYVDKKGRVARGKRFVAFYGGDYDGGLLTTHLFPKWDDPRRGEVPVTWAINPQLSRDAPRIYDHIRANATPNDFFIMADSGPGYVNPGHFQAPRPDSGAGDNLKAWLKWCETWVGRSGCDVCWVLDGKARSLNDNGLKEYAARFGRGLLTQKPYGRTKVGDVPVVQLVDYGTNLDASLVAAAPKSSSQFVPLRMIKWTPSMFADFASFLRGRSKAVEIVDVYTLMLLRKKANENGFTP